MFDNKFLITLIGMIVAVVAINHIKDKEDDIKEEFLGNLPSMTTSAYAVQSENVQRALGNGKSKVETYEKAIPFGPAFQVAARIPGNNPQHFLNPQTCGQNSLAGYAQSQNSINPYQDQESYENPRNYTNTNVNTRRVDQNNRERVYNNNQDRNREKFRSSGGQEFNKQRTYNNQVRDHKKSLDQNVSNENFVSYPSFQSNISPRFSSLDYGANIRYNFPSVENQGVPLDPLSMSKIVSDTQEDFPATCGVGGVDEGKHVLHGEENSDRRSARRRRRKMQIDDDSVENFVPAQYQDAAGDIPTRLAGSSGQVPPAGYVNGKSFNEGGDKVKNSNPDKVNSIMPVSDMTQQNAAHSENGVEQPVVYDRYIFSNRDSRIRSQGDWIRGDLPIVPNKHCWFQTSQSTDPFRVLNLGAMNVMRSSEDLDKLASFVTSINPANDIVAGSRLSKKELDSADDTAHALMSAQAMNTVDPSNGVQVTAFP